MSVFDAAICVIMQYPTGSSNATPIQKYRTVEKAMRLSPKPNASAVALKAHPPREADRADESSHACAPHQQPQAARAGMKSSVGDDRHEDRIWSSHQTDQSQQKQ
jgi:hypothetical protein